jgi:hypothetical protein
MSFENYYQLKNIGQENMLLSTYNIKDLSDNKLDSDNSNININNILDKEKENYKKDTWNKINITDKLKKLNDYSSVYCNENNIAPENIILLKNYFKKLLDKKKLSKTKDVIYDIKSQTIKSIPNLIYSNNNFFLKRSDNRVSTIKSLPITKNRTIKKKIPSSN